MAQSTSTVRKGVKNKPWRSLVVYARPDAPSEELDAVAADIVYEVVQLARPSYLREVKSGMWPLVRRRFKAAR